MDGTSHACSDGFFDCGNTSVTLQSPNDVWAAGEYTLALNIDGTAGECTLSTLSISGAALTNSVSGTCTAGADYALALTVADSCPPVMCNGNACGGMSCTPVPGHFQMTLTINAIPAQVALTLTTAGQTLVDQTIMPQAVTTEPNGEGCGTCTNASVTVPVSG